MGLNWAYFPIFGFPMYEPDPPQSSSSYKPNPIRYEEKPQPSFRSMPMNPALGQRWISAESGKNYIWEGTQWRLVDPSDRFTSKTPPTNPKEGDLWFY